VLWDPQHIRVWVYVLLVAAVEKIYFIKTFLIKIKIYIWIKLELKLKFNKNSLIYLVKKIFFKLKL